MNTDANAPSESAPAADDSPGPERRRPLLLATALLLLAAWLVFLTWTAIYSAP